MGRAWIAEDWIVVHGSNLRSCNVQQFRDRLVRKMGECTWCMGDTGSNRRRYCSEACRIETYIRCHPGSARYYVEKRDRGVCGGCGIDTNALFAKLARICNRKNDRGVEAWKAAHGGEYGDTTKMSFDERDAAFAQGRTWRRRWLRDHGFGSTDGGHYWEMDHVVPVIEGGGMCGLDGLRTACLRCHRSATARLAARLADDRAGRVRLPGMEVSA